MQLVTVYLSGGVNIFVHWTQAPGHLTGWFAVSPPKITRWVEERDFPPRFFFSPAAPSRGWESKPDFCEVLRPGVLNGWRRVRLMRFVFHLGVDAGGELSRLRGTTSGERGGSELRERLTRLRRARFRLRDVCFPLALRLGRG